jgi:hypothetical protein
MSQAPSTARLASDARWPYRHLAARRGDLPAELLERLARDPHWVVRCAVARRADLPAELLERLANPSEGKENQDEN